MTFIATRVGQALHSWSTVELELAWLFTIITEIPDRRISQVAFAAIVSFDARVQMCNSIMPLVTMNDVHRRYWTWLYNRLTKKVKKRNELAHFTIVIWENETGAQSVRLVPYYSEGSQIFQQNNGLSIDQIEERDQSFTTLQSHLAWLRAEMEVLKGLLLINPLPIPDRVHELRNEVSPKPSSAAFPPRL